MQWKYKGVTAEVLYSVATRCYYAEYVVGQRLVTFQASTQQELYDTMRQALDYFVAAIPTT